MKAFAKVLGLVVFGIVVLAAGVLFFLTRMFDPNDYKEDIQQAAREKANIELTLDGDIGWSLFPWLGIELKDVGVAPTEQPQQPLAQVGSLGLGVKVLPLLRRQLRMSDVILDDVQLLLVKDEDGEGNWANIGPQDSGEDSGTAGEQEPAPATKDRSMDFAVESVQITNASVRYEDRESGQLLTLEQANLTTGALIEGEPFDVSFLGMLTTDKPALRVRLDVKTVAQFDLGLKRYRFDALDMKVDASGEPFSGRAVNLQLQADGLVDLGAQVAELNQLRMSLGDMRATGALKATGLDSEPRLSGQLNVADFDARDLLRDLGQELPDMADPGALSKVSLSTSLSGSASSLMLNDLELVVDDASLKGQMGITDFTRQALRFSLVGDQLNLDNYLPPREEKQGDAAQEQASGGSRSTAPPPEWSDDAVLPLEQLARLDVDGSLELQKVTLTGLDISPFKAAVTAREGRILLKQLDGGVFSGTFTSKGEVDTRQTPVRLNIASQLKGIDSLAAQKAYEMPAQVRGALDLELDLSMRGNSMRRWMNTLTGNASFEFDEGALLGVNLEQQLCRAIALANRKSLSAEHGSEDTPFEQLSGSFTVRDGQISNRDLVVELPGITAKGTGEVNLPDQRLDYRIGLLLEGDKSDMPDEACQVNERYVGVEWPVRCQGYLHNAARSCGVDTEGVTKVAGQLLGNEAKRKLEERLDEKLGDKAPELRDAIKGLFSN
ncbi:MAG: AsmA family protein [Halopseudomonas sp.]|uniref:AsmA family protein n=1 Tax=Halopseudomonas sp. TaxID=2901191 RepID=UPI003001FB6C